MKSIYRFLIEWVMTVKRQLQHVTKRINVPHIRNQATAYLQQAWIHALKLGRFGFSYLFRQLNKIKLLLVTVTILAGLFVTGVWAGQAYYQANVSSIYHVYFENQEVGIVDQVEVVEDWYAERVRQVQEEHADAEIVFDYDLRFEQEDVYKGTFESHEDVIANIEAQLEVQAIGVEVVVDGEFIGYVSNAKIVEDLLDEVKEKYVPTEDLRRLSTQKESTITPAMVSDPWQTDDNHELLVRSADEQDSEQPDLTADELLEQPEIVQVQFEQSVQLQEKLINPDDLIDEEALQDIFSQTKVEEKIHTVQKGDVLGTIAQRYDLTLQKLLDLNPSISVNSILQIGQELLVEADEPFVSVLATERVTEEAVIPYGTQSKTDGNMWRGESRVERRGVEGLKRQHFEITKRNGYVHSKELIDEVILKEPEDQVVVRGTKVSPSRGTGDFRWPASGRLTDGFGPRWGSTHTGLDIANRTGTSVVASDNGVVTYRGYRGNYGNLIIINHNNGYETYYAHLSAFSVSRGQTVAKGQRIGSMGSTGRSTGPHLHFEIRRYGTPLNPARYLP